MPDNDTTAKLSVQVEGTQEATQRIENFARAVEKLNSGAAGVPGGESSFGSLTPAGAPRPGDGLGSYGNGSGISAGGTYLPLGANSGVLLGGGGYINSAPLAAGALAPNPLTGSVSGAGGAAGVGGGNTTIMASSVTIVGGGGGSGGAGGLGSGAYAAPNPPLGVSMPGGAGGGSHPFPGWNPYSPNPNQNPAPGFTQQVYDHLGNMGGMEQALAQKFLAQNPLGRQMFGGVAAMEGFLPPGLASGLAGGLASAAPWLSGVGMVGGLVAGAMNINNAATLPGYYQQTRELAAARAGQFYDPITRDTDRRLAESRANEGVYEAWRGNPVGWLGRIGSFGIADAVWDGYIRPGFDRDRALIQADGDYKTTLRDLRRLTGDNYITPDIAAYDREIHASESYNRRPWYQKMGGRYSFDPLTRGLSMEEMGRRRDTSIKNLQGERGLADMLGPYALGNASRVRGFGFGDYKDETPEHVLQNLSPILRGMEMPGNEASRRALFEGKTGIQGGFGVARESYIFSGDVNSLAAMTLEYKRTYGADFLKYHRADIDRGLKMGEARTAGAIGQNQLSAGHSSLEGLRLSGASGYTIAAGTDLLAGEYGPILSSLQAQLAAAPNELRRSEIRAQIVGLRTTIQGEKHQAEMMRFSTRQTEIGTESSLAGTSLTRAMYGNSEAGVVGAFGKQGGALRDRVSLLRKMSASPFISSEERKQYAAEAAAAQTELDISLPRQVGDFRLGLRQGELGIAGSRVATQAERAGLFGGISDVYGASLSQAGITEKQLGYVGQELAGDFGQRTQTERLDLQKQAIDLQRQLNVELEQARRSYASANLSVTQFTQGMVSTGANYRQAFFGVGGAEAGTNQSAVVGASRASLSVAQKNFDAVASLPADNPYRQQRERELLDAKMGAQSAVQAFAQLPVSVDLQRAQMAGQFRLNAMQHSYIPWGDVRGAVAGLMNTVGAEGRELSAQQRMGLSAIESDSSLTSQEKAQRRSVLLRDFESRRYGLGNELLGYQQQLEQGWQDRLVSSTVGMPGRGAFVASRFTQKEASHFLQNYSSVFGFSGEGAEGQRDFYKFRGPQLASSVIGVIQRPEGFAATGLAEAMGGGNMGGGNMGGGVLRPRVNAGGSGTAGGVEGAAQALVAAIVAAVGNGGQGGGNNPYVRGGVGE